MTEYVSHAIAILNYPVRVLISQLLNESYLKGWYMNILTFCKEKYCQKFWIIMIKEKCGHIKRKKKRKEKKNPEEI